MNTHTSNQKHLATSVSKPFAYVALLALLLTALTQIGCIGATRATSSTSQTGSGATSTTPATSPTTPAAPAVAGALNASAASLSFGSVTTGSNSVLPVSFTNGGSSAITVSNIVISGPGFTAAGAPGNGLTAGLILSPGQTAILDVTFAPAATGAASGSVAISSNAANAVATVNLAGTGAQSSTHSVELNWSASSAVIGYNVYRSSIPGGPYNAVTTSPVSATRYTDSGVQGGQTYYYVVTSINSSNVASAYSAQVTAAVPTN